MEIMSEQEQPPGLPSYWIWILILFLGVLLLVPVISIATSIQKTGWVPVKRVVKPKPQQPSLAEELEEQQVRQNSLSLRERVEKIVAASIKVPKLHPKMQQVKIETSEAPSLKKASDSVHRVFESRKLQFVEALEKDRVRLIVIIPGHEWPDLSRSLQVAADEDGFIYRGPNQTSTADSSDSMVAEIVIIQNPGHSKKKVKAGR